MGLQMLHCRGEHQVQRKSVGSGGPSYFSKGGVGRAFAPSVRDEMGGAIARMRRERHTQNGKEGRYPIQFKQRASNSNKGHQFKQRASNSIQTKGIRFK